MRSIPKNVTVILPTEMIDAAGMVVTMIEAEARDNGFHTARFPEVDRRDTAIDVHWDSCGAVWIYGANHHKSVVALTKEAKSHGIPVVKKAIKG